MCGVNIVIEYQLFTSAAMRRDSGCILLVYIVNYAAGDKKAFGLVQSFPGRLDTQEEDWNPPLYAR